MYFETCCIRDMKWGNVSHYWSHRAPLWTQHMLTVHKSRSSENSNTHQGNRQYMESKEKLLIVT